MNHSGARVHAKGSEPAQTKRRSHPKKLAEFAFPHALLLMNPHVLGIGGIFFRAKDPKKLAQWYEQHLGITPPGGSELWQTTQGIVVFAPFKQDSDYFPQQQPVMVNFRVKDLDTLLSKLKGDGVRIDDKRQDEVYGRFAWIYDGEGNKVELWEPAESS